MRLDIKFVENSNILPVVFSECQVAFPVTFGDYQTVTEYVGGSPYDGEYVITPRVTEQTMATKEKVMLEDVTILAIPYAEVSNSMGGETATIG